MGGSPGHSALIADPPGRGCGTCRNSGFNYLRGAAGNQPAGRGCGRSGLGHHAEEGGERALFSRALPPQTSILGVPTAATHRQEPPSCLPSSRDTASSRGAPPLQAGSRCRAGDPLTVHPTAASPLPSPCSVCCSLPLGTGQELFISHIVSCCCCCRGTRSPHPHLSQPPRLPPAPAPQRLPPGGCSVLPAVRAPLAAAGHRARPQVPSLCHHLPPLCAQHRSLAP